MKYFSSLLLVVLLLSCGTKQIVFSDYFSPIGKDKLTIDAKLRAESFATTYIRFCEKDSILTNNQFTFGADFRASISTEKFKRTCQKTKDTYGTLNEITLSEIQGDGANIIVYRFKGDFENVQEPTELRVYQMFTNEFTGIVITPWEDTLRSKKEIEAIAIENETTFNK